MAVAGVAKADPPFYQPPHGLLVVEIDKNNKLFSRSVTGSFNDLSHITFNAAGHTILKHNLPGISGTTVFPGGIAERDGGHARRPPRQFIHEVARR